MTGVVPFIMLKKKLGWGKDPVRKNCSCYTCRHTFAHRMLSGFWNGGIGCSIETLAELMGNTPKVAFDHYGREWGQNYTARGQELRFCDEVISCQLSVVSCQSLETTALASLQTDY